MENNNIYATEIKNNLYMMDNIMTVLNEAKEGVYLKSQQYLLYDEFVCKSPFLAMMFFRTAFMNENSVSNPVEFNIETHNNGLIESFKYNNSVHPDFILYQLMYDIPDLLNKYEMCIGYIFSNLYSYLYADNCRDNDFLFLDNSQNSNLFFNHLVDGQLTDKNREMLDMYITKRTTSFDEDNYNYLRFGRLAYSEKMIELQDYIVCNEDNKKEFFELLEKQLNKIIIQHSLYEFCEMNIMKETPKRSVPRKPARPLGW